MKRKMTPRRYEDFLDFMDHAGDWVWKARKEVNPDGEYKEQSIKALDRAIGRLNQARRLLEATR